MYGNAIVLSLLVYISTLYSTHQSMYIQLTVNLIVHFRRNTTQCTVTVSTCLCIHVPRCGFGFTACMHCVYILYIILNNVLYDYTEIYYPFPSP